MYPTSRPSDPKPGDVWVDVYSRVVNVYNGEIWITFTEAEMIEMEITQLLIQAGHSEQEAQHMIHVLQHAHGHRE